MLRASAEEPHNHGASLTEFFDILVDRLPDTCTVVIKPKIVSLRPLTKDASSLLTRLSDLLEGAGYSDRGAQPETYAYSYSLSPRLNENAAEQTQQRSSASGSVPGQRAGLDQKVSSDAESIEAAVLGFNRSRSANDRDFRGARFGWVIAPRPEKGLDWSLQLAQEQLSAVVAMPSWWRSALLQICTRFVKADGVAKIMEPELWNSAEHCRAEVIRLPGTSSDLSRQLGMDVLTTP